MSRKDWTDEKLFARLVNNRTRATYWENVSALRQRPTNFVFQTAVELTKSDDNKKRIIGLNVLAQLGFNPRFRQRETSVICFNLLEKEQTPWVLESILFAISHNNQILKKNQILSLIKLKTHRYCIVRFALVQALSGLEQKDAIDALIALSTDRDSDIRDWATFSLGTQIETSNVLISAALWERTKDSVERVRFEAIFGLAKRHDTRIKNVLIQELNRIGEQGSLILESIEELNDYEFIELLEKQIERNKKTQQINEKWLMNTLNHVRANAGKKDEAF